MSSALAVSRLSKTFPGVRALTDLEFSVEPGNTLAILGHNGSGKSTAIKLLAGLYSPDPGARMWIAGEETSFDGKDSGHASLRFVHQDLGVIDELTVMENVALTVGWSRSRFGRIDWDAQRRKTVEILEEFGISLDLRTRMSEASAVERTAVAVARALVGLERGKGVLVLDEPTASLPTGEVDRLFELISSVTSTGTAVIYVSHRLDEIFQVADDVIVLRDGRTAARGALAAFTKSSLAHAIAGKALATHRRVPSVPEKREPALTLSGLTTSLIRRIDLEIARGEVVGVAGLLGSGREDIGYAIAGARKAEGEWRTSRGSRTDARLADAGQLGIAFVPGDRARESLVKGFTVGENLSLAALTRARRRFRVLSRRGERELVSTWMERGEVTKGTEQRPIETLSGGNQQKVIVARWLATQPEVLVMAEPTSGVDVGARESLFNEVRHQAEQGLGVIIASSDVEDLTAICHRVLVMVGGRVTAVLAGADIDAAVIVERMSESPMRDGAVVAAGSQ